MVYLVAFKFHSLPDPLEVVVCPKYYVQHSDLLLRAQVRFNLRIDIIYLGYFKEIIETHKTGGEFPKQPSSLI